MKDFSEILLSELHKRGITPTALGRAVDISPSAMSNYKKGRIPKSDELYRIAEHLNVSMEYLLTGEERASEFPAQVSAPGQQAKLPDLRSLDAIIEEMETNLRMLQSFRDSFYQAPDEEEPDSRKKIVNLFPDEPSTELPFYGQIAAGQPAIVDFYQDDTRKVPGTFKGRSHYLLRVRGESMEPDFPDGSYVVVRALEAGEYARKGDIVVANDVHGPTMKKLEYRKTGPKGDTPRKPTPHLVSINPEFGEVTPVADAPVQGIVVDRLPADFFDS